MPIIPIRRSFSLSAIRVRCNTLLVLLPPVIVGCLISACSFTLKPSPVLESVAELPDEFAGSEVVGSYESLEWWKTFADPVLDQVIEAALAEVRLHEAAAAFGRSVVTAVNEVEAALVGLEASYRRHSLLASLAEEAQAEAASQEQRYVSGVGDYESFLTATHTFLDTQSVLATAARDLGYARLALHRALGGAWTANEREALQQNTQSSLLSTSTE